MRKKNALIVAEVGMVILLLCVQVTSAKADDMIMPGDDPYTIARKMAEQDKARDKARDAEWDAVNRAHEAQDREYEERHDAITAQSMQEIERDKQINNLRQKSQQKQHQQWIDNEQKDVEEDDNRAIDLAIAHDSKSNGDYEQAKQWEEKARGE